MDTMPQNELLEYLKTAIDIETDLATQEQIISEYDAYSKKIKPRLAPLPEPKAPVYDYRGPTGKGSRVFGIFLFAFFGLLPALVLLFCGVDGGGIFLLIGIGLLIWALCISQQEGNQQASYQKEYDALQSNYQRNLANIQSANKKTRMSIIPQ